MPRQCMRTTLACKVCGKSFTATPSQVAHGRTYCSRECWREGNKGAGNPAWKDAPHRVCVVCGKQFHVKPSRLVNGNPRYCSMKCMGLDRRNQIQRTCEACGAPFLGIPSHIARGQDRFCSPPCWYKHLSTIRGAEKWTWKGGIRLRRRGDMARSEYKEWRAAVFARDHFTCQRCGDNSGGKLNAHHIMSYRDHAELRLDVDNGITLCETCHKEAHRIRK